MNRDLSNRGIQEQDKENVAAMRVKVLRSKNLTMLTMLESHVANMLAEYREHVLVNKIGPLTQERGIIKQLALLHDKIQKKIKTLSIRNERQANVQRLYRAVVRSALGRVSVAKQHVEDIETGVSDLRKQLENEGYDPVTRVHSNNQDNTDEALEVLKLLDSEREVKDEQ